ncbi:MAG: AzlC family ABC transporter permease [Archaeoglobus sp.]|nr:AzlC family ABC transporter permease [Archaeoglobus sp.]
MDASEVKLAAKHSLPIVLGYLPASMAFGVLAANYLGNNSILMSALVFAGASQFAALQLVILSSSAVFIVFTTFLINLRHILMSSFLNTYHKSHGRLKKILIAFGITDETFAIASNGLKELSLKSEQESSVSVITSSKAFTYQFTLNSISYLSWVFGTFLGFKIGGVIPGEILEVLPFVLTALFLYLLVTNISSRRDVGIAAVAGIIAVLLSKHAVGWNIFIATVVACFIGGKLERKERGDGFEER